jgi:hypothetical protein
VSSSLVFGQEIEFGQGCFVHSFLLTSSYIIFHLVTTRRVHLFRRVNHHHANCETDPAFLHDSLSGSNDIFSSLAPLTRCQQTAWILGSLCSHFPCFAPPAVLPPAPWNTHPGSFMTPGRLKIPEIWSLAYSTRFRETQMDSRVAAISHLSRQQTSC